MNKYIVFLLIFGIYSALNGRIDEQGNTPLMQAIAQGNVSQAKTLIEKNRFILEYNNLRQNALMIALRHKQYELVRLLVQAGANVNHIDAEGNCVLSFVSFSQDDGSQLIQDYRIVKFLIDYGLLVYGKSWEWTPLMQSCFDGETSLVKLLLEQGANPNICTSKGASALLCAIERNNVQIVELLLKSGVKVDDGIHYSFDILAWATLYGNLSIIQLLLAHTQNKIFFDNKRAYELALLLEHSALIKIFHEYFPTLKSDFLIGLKQANEASYFTSSPDTFENAVTNNDITMVRNSLLNRMDQLKINKALFLALRGSNEMISFLAAHHADVNGLGENGLTPLMIAGNALNVAMVRSLLANGANPSLIINGSTALFSAINCIKYENKISGSGQDLRVWTDYYREENQSEIVFALLNHGAQPNIKNRKGLTALMETVRNGYNNIIPLLLTAGADCELVDQEGNTALHHACLEGNQHAILMLLRFGALSSKMNIFGNTPLDLVVKSEKLDEVSKSQLIKLLNNTGQSN